MIKEGESPIDLSGERYNYTTTSYDMNTEAMAMSAGHIEFSDTSATLYEEINNIDGRVSGENYTYGPFS
ncbi:MAG: hypothetical protein SWH68_13600 [Thermodesulfobacteriota bacterium]|nr:hypothetical protein [Thermodesulfobacteriota bacterium]